MDARALATRRATHTAVRLGPLSTAESESVLTAFFGESGNGLPDRLRDLVVLSFVRDHADLAFAKLGIGLDAFDERGAAGGRRKLLLEGDDLGAIAGDGLQRFQRVGIGERQRMPEVLGGGID